MSISFIYPNLLWLLILIPVMIGLSVYGPRRLDKPRYLASLILRSLIFLILILAVAGFQIHLSTDTLTTIFILDASDSIPPEQKENAEAIINLAIQEMPGGDKAAIVVFGKDALVERLASENSALADLESVPITTQTNISNALQLAMALFPNEGSKRAILLSDGQENLGVALEQADLLALSQIELLYYPLNNEPQGIEVMVEALEAPSSIRQGEQLQLTATIRSSAPIGATLQITGDNNEIVANQQVTLSQGENQFLFPITLADPGFHRFRVQITPEADSRLQNNEASAFVLVSGPPKILIIEGMSGEGTNLSNALIAGEMLVTVRPPSGMPTTLLEASDYEAILLINTPSSMLPDGSMEIIRSYVRDLGKGFAMIGGESAFGAGGYLRTPIEETLPVNMDVRSKELTANLALILAIDKSGSMGRCHCDDPDLNQEYTRQEVGQPKVDIAKEAVMKAASALGSEDYLGVVAFDESARWALESAKLASYSTIENAIGGILAEGQTNIWAGVEAAYQSLSTIDAKKKHVILLTDGWSQTGDITPLVEELASNGITLSIIAAGGGSAEYLETLSEIGNGRYYPAQDILRVPDIFLKETVQSVGRYIIEEPFFPLPESPGPSLNGIDTLTLPPILGYNGTTPKTAARLDLISPTGDPLLATWQFGLGRSAAWTSDMKGHWAEQWITWDGYAKFSTQLIGWMLPEPKSDFIEATASLINDTAEIKLTAKDDSGQLLNFVQANAVVVLPNLETQEIVLEQVGPGTYSGTFEANLMGAYLIRVGANDQNFQSLGQQTLGLVVPFSPEYKTNGIDLAKLNQLAQKTGGSELLNPADAFLHNLTSTAFAVELWRPLLLITALLFPFDVAIRRLVLSKGDFQKMRLWFREKLKPRSREISQEPKVLENLFQARDRARKMHSFEETQTEDSQQAEPDITRTSADKSVEDEVSGASDQEEDTLARLRKAKDRTKRKD
jgi:Mg-chelatase subunit ChlD